MPLDRAQLCRELVRDEGVCLKPYRDTEGIFTIGVGHNLEAVPLPKHWTAPLSMKQVDTLLESDLTRTIDELNLRAPWWKSLDPVRQRVIANMAFNLGVPRLLLFKKMIAAIKLRRWRDAAIEMKNSRWATQVGARASRLAMMMLNGADDAPDLDRDARIDHESSVV